MSAIEIDGEPLSDAKRYFLVRFWLATPEARAADPAPLGDVAALRKPRPGARLCASAGDQRTARHRCLCAARGGLFAGLRPCRADQSRLRRTRGGGRLCRCVGRGADGRRAARCHSRRCAASMPCSSRGPGASPPAAGCFCRCIARAGRSRLSRRSGLALFLQEFLRLTQGSRLNWVSPIFNAPFGVARAGDFVVTTAPNALLAAGLAFFAGAALIALMTWTRFGRNWRAYADDPLAAQMFGVDPSAIFARTFALASGFAGLAGFVMTMFYGSVGYGSATTLGLKALIAAILGGIGSVPGAFLGGLLVGALRGALVDRLPHRLPRRRGLQPAGDPPDAASRRDSWGAGERPGAQVTWLCASIDAISVPTTERQASMRTTVALDDELDCPGSGFDRDQRKIEADSGGPTGADRQRERPPIGALGRKRA